MTKMEAQNLPTSKNQQKVSAPTDSSNVRRIATLGTIAGPLKISRVTASVIPYRFAFQILQDYAIRNLHPKRLSRNSMVERTPEEGLELTYNYYYGMYLGSIISMPVEIRYSALLELCRFIETKQDATGVEALYASLLQSVWWDVDMNFAQYAIELWNTRVKEGEFNKYFDAFVFDNRTQILRRYEKEEFSKKVITNVDLIYKAEVEKIKEKAKAFAPKFINKNFDIPGSNDIDTINSFLESLGLGKWKKSGNSTGIGNNHIDALNNWLNSLGFPGKNANPSDGINGLGNFNDIYSWLNSMGFGEYSSGAGLPGMGGKIAGILAGIEDNGMMGLFGNSVISSSKLGEGEAMEKKGVIGLSYGAVAVAAGSAIFAGGIALKSPWVAGGGGLVILGGLFVAAEGAVIAFKGVDKQTEQSHSSHSTATQPKGKQEDKPKYIELDSEEDSDTGIDPKLPANDGDTGEGEVNPIASPDEEGSFDRNHTYLKIFTFPKPLPADVYQDPYSGQVVARNQIVLGEVEVAMMHGPGTLTRFHQLDKNNIMFN